MYDQGYRPPQNQPAGRRSNRRANSASSPVQAGYYSPPPQYAPQTQQPYYQQPASYDQHPASQGYVPPKPPKAVKGKKGGPKPPRKKFPLAAILASLVVLTILGAGGFYYRVHKDVTAYDQVFCQGVYIDGIHLGGLTVQEASQQVQAQAQARENSWYVQLMYGDQLVATITAPMLGMNTQTQHILEEAWQLGHIGNIFERQQAMEALLAQPYEAYTAIPSASNTQAIDDLLLTIKNSVYRAPQDAKLLGFDPNAPEPFLFQAEVYGRTLDIQPLKETIYQMVSKMESGTLQVEPTPIYPTVTVADLQPHYTLLANVTTQVDKHSTDNRTNNLIRACELINGKIVQPDKKFSFNSTVGPRSIKNGFYEAIEYAYGVETMGVGGGVCQVSSTLYLAVLRAGMDIVHREPHSKEVSYTIYGQDATVNYEGKKIDFVFRNSSDYPIYITAAVEDDPNRKNRYICRVRVYGESLGENTFYDLESTTVQVLKPTDEIIYDKDKTGEHVVYTDQTKKKSNGKEGYVVETYRSKVVNGVEVEKELVSTDTYKAQQPRYWVGVTER
ncbi:MAG: VanW family protein [Clostridia bacterium]|nr:VanW family protein [Clostridia bacterium]